MAVNSFLDEERLREHKARNLVQSYLIAAALGALTGFSAWLIWSWVGVFMAFLTIGSLYALAPRLPPEIFLRMYRARPLDARHGQHLTSILDALAARAQLVGRPRLYVVPSMTLNAFATGTPERPAIAVTEGLLRRLSLREIAAVMAHEISHIRNNDLGVMALADMMSRYTQLLSYVALFLALLNLPNMLIGEDRISWIAILLLYLAPTASSLLQLALSRTREFDADLEGAMLTGDPAGLASALQRLEQYQGHFWEDLMFPVPGRRIPQPSLLRSHPATAERIARLRELDQRSHLAPLAFPEEPMVTLIGFGPITMRPRYRLPGVWY
jgi:heat shock protein HtpX